MIASGGLQGGEVENPKLLKSRDNFLFWGEPGSFRGTTIFRGGRNEARKAGVNMRNGRGRFNYILDANGDGLLDIFTSQTRRATNDLVPGVLLINQGNRTWSRDPSLREYSSSMMLTDADGDGLAQEFLMSRGFCYPQKEGITESQMSKEIINFCSSRPVGSTVVYKYNKGGGRMKIISDEFSNVDPSPNKQPACCPHGSWDGSGDCNARSMATGDFDNDQKADHVFLYSTKLVFYFSTDRGKGELPIGPGHQGHEIILPKYCMSGQTIRVVDFDNSGVEHIMVMCKNPGTFLLYSLKYPWNKKSWTLDNSCNRHGSMGDLVDISLAIPTDSSAICEGKKDWSRLEEYCTETPPTAAMGMATVDLNNDGFLDLVITHSFGFLRFFHNIPSSRSRQNEFISFTLRGNGVGNNVYGVGSTLILYYRKAKNMVSSTQFREISSHQHYHDEFGTRDERVTFGIGRGSSPLNLIVRWSNGYTQKVSLSAWKFSSYLNPIQIMDTSGKSSSLMQVLFWF